MGAVGSVLSTIFICNRYSKFCCCCQKKRDQTDADINIDIEDVSCCSFGNTTVSGAGNIEIGSA
jgi:hypothetical protein